MNIDATVLWRTAPTTPLAVAMLALVSALGGALVGAEREKKEKPAGLRTLTLVSLGAAVFTMLSVALAGPHGDPARIAAQVVTGIGFLGAGAILRGSLGVMGLTTAATIWVVAAAGMVIGAGYWLAGLAVDGLALVVLTVAAAWEQRYLGPCRFRTVELVFDPHGGKATVKIGRASCRERV